MHIYMMNLDRAPDRLSYMKQSFDALGIHFTRISAVDGRSLSETSVRQFNSEEGYGGWLTPSEVGCFMSHRLCWRAIADGDDQYAAVFEDDALLGEDAGGVLSSSAWIPDDADIVKIETATSRIYVDKVDSGKIDHFSVRRLRSGHVAAGAYIISKDAAKRLLQKSRVVHEPVDDFLFSIGRVVFGGFRIYQLLPAVCIQRVYVEGSQVDEFPSSIEGRQQKIMKRSIANRAKLVAFKESHTALNKLLCLLGKRERIVVEFK